MITIGLADMIGGSRVTEREAEVLGYAARGFTSEQTAIILFLSVETVKHHRKQAIAKLYAANTTHAVALAARDGLIDLDELLE